MSLTSRYERLAEMQDPMPCVPLKCEASYPRCPNGWYLHKMYNGIFTNQQDAIGFQHAQLSLVSGFVLLILTSITAFVS